MPIRTICPNPNCGKTFHVSSKAVGKKAKCERCQTRFLVREGQGEAIAIGTADLVSAIAPQLGSSTPQDASAHLDAGEPTGDQESNKPPPLPGSRAPAMPLQEESAGRPDSEADNHEKPAPPKWEKIASVAHSTGQWCVWIGSHVGRLLKLSFTLIVNATQFYWMYGTDLFTQLVDYAETLKAEPRDRLCDIRLHSRQRRTNAEWNNVGWRVHLPELCVVCGEIVDDAIDEEREIPNLRWPLWAVVAGLGGAVLSWYAGSVLLAIVSVFGGFLLGYLTRSWIRVQVRYSQCRDHIEGSQYPKLLGAGSRLRITVGHQNVRKKFDSDRTTSSKGSETAVHSPRLDQSRKHTEEAIKAVISDDEVAAVDRCQVDGSETDDPGSWHTGDVVENLYEIMGVLADNDTGTAYRIHHRGWDVYLVVRSPRPGYFRTEQQKQDFTNQVETWAKLGPHPHTVSCYYVRELDGIPRAFMEDVDGETLFHWIQRGNLYQGGQQQVLERILDFAIQAARGLLHAHEHGVSHNSVCSENVLITSIGVVRVANFGVTSTAPSLVHSPEQHASIDFTNKTDVWSWGVLVLEMFTGDAKWTKWQSVHQALDALLDVGPGDPSRPGIPKSFAELLRQCFLAEPQGRPDLSDVVSRLGTIYTDVFDQSYSRPSPQLTKLRADTFNNRALSALDLGDEQQAERLFGEALEVDPYHRPATYNRGLFWWRSNRLEPLQLIQQIESIGETLGTSWEDGFLSGMFHLERGDAFSAVRLLDDATSQAPANETRVKNAQQRALAAIERPNQKMKTFQRHVDSIRSAAISPNGQWAIAAARDNKIDVWDLDAGKFVRTLEKHTVHGNSRVTDVTISPNGQWALSGHENGDNAIRWWVLATGKCLRSFQPDGLCVAFSPDGLTGIAGRADGTLRLWDLSPRGQCIRTFERHKGVVTSVAFLPDGETVLSGSDDKTVRLWDLESGEIIAVYEGHTARVTSVVALPGGTKALSGSVDKTLRLWDLLTGKCILTIDGHSNAVTSVATIMEGELAISGSVDGTVRIWSLKTGRCRQVLQQQFGGVTSIAVSADDCRLLVSSNALYTTELYRSERQPMVVCRAEVPLRDAAPLAFLDAEERVSGPSDAILETALESPGSKDAAAFETVAQSVDEGYSESGQPLETRPLETQPLETRLAENVQRMDAGLGASAPSPNRSLVANEADVPAVWRQGDVILDLYEVQGVLGEGGMGTVYQVHHKGWNLDLAVKSPKPKFFRSEQDKRNFIAECETWVNLGLHPHTVSCFYVRTLGGIPRVFAEYVEGNDLEEWIQSGKLYEGGPEKALERILDIAIQFAWGLHYAHEQGLVHQDVKPANVMMTSDGIAKVTDFGLAKARAAAGESHSGRQRQVLCTVEYCSPEQAGGEKLSPKTDIWSWAVSVLEMFVGDVTWQSGTVAREALEDYLAAGPGDTSLPVMPDALAELLRQCLQVASNMRPQHCAETASVLISIYEDRTNQSYGRPAPEPATLLADTLNNQAISLLDIDRSSAAEALWNDALGADPHHIEANYNQSLHFWRTGRITDEEVVQRMEDVRATHQESWLDEFLLGRIHVERGDTRNAIEFFEQAQRQTPEENPAVCEALEQSKIQLRGKRDELSVFQQYCGLIQSIAIAPNGRLAVTGGNDKMVRMWDLTTGSCLQTFEGHESKVNSVSVSRDGTRILSGSYDSTFRLWDLTTRTCLHTSQKWGGAVDVFVFLKDGKHAIVRTGSELRVWDLESNQHVQTLEGSMVTSLALTPNELYTVSASLFDKTLSVNHLPTGDRVRQLEGHTEQACCVAISPDGTRVLSGGGGSLRLWDFASGSCLHIFNGHREAIYSVAFTPDGLWGISASWDTTVRLWNLSTGQCVRTIEAGVGALNSIATTPDGRFAITGGHHGMLVRWEFSKGTRQSMAVARPTHSEQSIKILSEAESLLKQAKQLLTDQRYKDAWSTIDLAMSLPGCERRPELLTLRNRLGLHGVKSNLATAWCRSKIEGHKEKVNSVAITPDGERGISAGDDRTIRLWDLRTGQCLQKFEGHGHRVNAVAFLDKCNSIVSASQDETIRIWELSSGACSVKFAAGSSVGSLAISPDGHWVVSGNQDNTVRLWDPRTGRCIRKWEGHDFPIWSVSFTPDGMGVLSGSTDTTFRLWNLATGNCVQTFGGDAIWSHAISADGQFVASGHYQKLRLWNLSSSEHLKSVDVESGQLSSLSFVPGGRWLVSAGSDNTVRIWDIATGTCARILQGHTDDVNSVAVTANGCCALTGSSDQSVRLWDLCWEYEFPEFVDWAENARPLLEHFLILNQPYSGKLPDNREPTPGEAQRALTRSGNPHFRVDGVQELLLNLGHQGFGWLRPEGVKRKLEEMTRNWSGPPVAKMGRLTSQEAELDPRENFLFNQRNSVASESEPSGIDHTQRARNLIRDVFGQGVAPVTQFQDGSFRKQFNHHKTAINVVTFSPDGRCIASGATHRSGTECDPVGAVFTLEGELVLQISADLQGQSSWTSAIGIDSLAYSPDGARLLVGRTAGGIELWDIASQQLLWSHKLYAGGQVRVAYSPDGKYAARSFKAKDEQIQIRDISTGDVIRQFGQGTHSISFLSDPSLLFSSPIRYFPDGKNCVEVPPTLWDVTTGRRVRELLDAPTTATCAAVSPDGKYVLLGHENNYAQKDVLQLWDFVTGKSIGDFDREKIGPGITAIAISSDGRYAVTGGKDYSVRLWDISSGKCLQTFEGHTDTVSTVSISHDHGLIASACAQAFDSNDVSIRLWENIWH